ncbi:MAG: hypothetical protein PF541_01970, partial [Prolixibacteraceae bacterium]|nr:hypothetical protein [Prolixibacteraceae bacterium]
MKKSTNLFIALAIVIGLIIGFLVGVSVDFPNPQNAELSGTIGRINNYRNVKINESDIKLRSELQSNELILKSYLRYLSFHYASSAKLFNEIDKALIAIEAFPVFTEKEADKLLAIQKLQSNLEEARKDILLALSSLQNLSEENEGNIGHLINNANLAIAKVKYLENSLLDFMEITATLLDEPQEQNKQALTQLALSHDHLLATKVA